MSNRCSELGSRITVLALVALALGCPGQKGQDPTGTRKGGVSSSRSRDVSTTAPTPGAPVETALHLCIDSSGSMAGYAQGDGCYDRLWTEFFETARSRAGLDQFGSWLVGDSVRKGPEIGNLRNWAGYDPRRGIYPDQRTALVPFLRSDEIFSEKPGTVVAFVSDMEPDLDDPSPDCASSGSVVCLLEGLDRLALREWSLWLIGFESRFRGSKYYPEFRADGTVNSNAKNPLEGEPVPVYILVAARDVPTGERFVTTISKMIDGCTTPENFTSRSIRLTGFPPAIVRADLSRIPKVIYQIRKTPRGTETEGKIALRLADAAPNEVSLKIYESDYPVRIEIPVSAQVPSPAIPLPQLEWTVTGSVGIDPDLLKASFNARVPSLKVGGGAAASSGTSVQIAFSPAFLEKARAGAELTIRFTSRSTLSAQPWSDWSYHQADPVAEPSYKTRTFRTAEVLEELIRKQLKRTPEGGTNVSTIRIRLSGG